MSYRYEMKKDRISNINWKVNDITITCDCEGDHFEVELEGHVDKRAIDFCDFDLIKDYIQEKLNDQYHRTYPFTPADMYPPAEAFYEPKLRQVNKDKFPICHEVQKAIYKIMLNSVYGAHGQHQLTKLGQPCEIRRVIFNDPATIVMWSDGTKTVVKCQDGDIFDPEKGLAMAISKKAFGNTGSYCDEIKKWTEEYYKKEPELKFDPRVNTLIANINIPKITAQEISDIVDDALKKLDEMIGKDVNNG